MSDREEETPWSARLPVAPEERIDLRLRGARAGEELPLRLLVMGDYGRTPGADRWRAIEVTAAGFAQAVFGEGIERELTVPNHLGGDASTLNLRLTFRRMSDLEPEAIVASQPELRRLLERRRALSPLKAFLGSEKAFRVALQQALDDPHKRAALAAYVGDESSRARMPGFAAEVAARREEAATSHEPSRLHELAKSRDPVVGRRVAQNAATPRACLAALSWSFAEEVARHPAVLQDAASDPTTVRDLGFECASRVLVAVGVAANVLEAWAGSDDDALRVRVAACPASPPQVLVRLAAQPSAELAWCLAQNASAPEPALQLLYEHYRRDPHSGRHDGWMRVVVQHPGWSSAGLERILSDSEPKVLGYLAERDDLPEALLWRLAGVRRRGERPLARWLRSVFGVETAPHIEREINLEAAVEARRAVAANPTTPPALLEVLAQAAESSVRAAAAAHPNAPLGSLELLCEDVDAEVRRAVATNPAASRQLLRRLLDDDDDDVRKTLARSPALEEVDVAKLATDAHLGVRVALVRRPGASPALLAAFSADADDGLRHEAELRAALGTTLVPSTKRR